MVLPGCHSKIAGTAIGVVCSLGSLVTRPLEARWQLPEDRTWLRCSQANERWCDAMREVSRHAQRCRTRTSVEPEFAGKGHAGGAEPTGHEHLVAA